MPKPFWGWVAKSLMMGTCLLCGFAAGITAVYYVQFYLPADTYDHTRQGEWASLNARLMAFEDEFDFKTAETGLYQALNDPKNAENLTAYYLLGSLFEARGEDAKALQTYQAYLKLSEALPIQGYFSQDLSDDVHASLALLYYRGAKPEQARAMLAEIPEDAMLEDAPLVAAMADVLNAPGRGDFHYTLGKAFRQRLDLPMARQEFELALAKTQDPNLKLRIQNTLTAKMPARTSHLSPMARYLCLAADKLEANALRQKASPSLNAEEARAISLYKRSIAVAPDFEWAYQQIAHLYQKQEAYGQATHYAKLALSYNPNLYLSRLTLGDIALAQADYATAAEQFSDASRILSELQDDYHQPLRVNVETQIGFSEELLENPRAALGHYQQALTLGRETPFAEASDIEYAQEGVNRMKADLIQQKSPKVKFLAEGV